MRKPLILIKTNKMNRICVYLTYDKQNIIDKYIGYMLKELKTCVDTLIIVCNMEKINQGLEILDKYADNIFYRKNIGFDAGGFKDGLCDFLGWDEVLKYNELVLINDSMFGPFIPMKNIFDDMESKNIDFWGLTKHGESIDNDMGHILEHIQSFFLVIRYKMLHSSCFREYWENMPYYKTFYDTVIGHEIKFTRYFADLGYTYDTYTETEINDSKDIRNNYMQYGTISYELIKKRKFPFLKKQQIAFETLNKQTQENLRQAIDYIDKSTSYDINYIWDNIIRTLNITDLQRSLHLQYIISEKTKQKVQFSVVILFFIRYKESFEYIWDYICDTKLKDNIEIFAENPDFIMPYQRNGFRCRVIRFDEIVKHLTEFSNFDFVAVLHDVDMTSHIRPSCTGKSFFYNIWNNLFKDDTHVYGIIELFFQESRLGFLTSPQPNFGVCFGKYGIGWNGDYEDVYNLVRKLNINCQLSESCAPFRVVDDFWIRGCILEKLRYIEDTDVRFLPYLWSYFAQDAGYYSGIVESEEYASMNSINLQYYLRQITSQIRYQYGDFNSFPELIELLHVSSIQKYCGQYSKNYVYGAGDIAKKYIKSLPNIVNCIVSDGQKKNKYLEKIPIKYLSEVDVTNDCGIVLCLNEKNQKQVIPILENRGIKHYYCV